MHPKLRAAVLLLTFTFLFAPAAWAGGELEIRWWSPDLSTVADIDGSEFDTELEIPTSLDLGFEADEEIEGRLMLRSSWGLFLRAAYQNISSSGSTEVEIGVVGLPIDVTAELGGNLDFEYGRLALGWMFGDENGPTQGGLFVEAKAVRGDVSLTASALGASASASDDFEAAVPAAGAMLRFKSGSRVEIVAEASTAVDTDEADVFDYEISARYLLSDGFAVSAGYRSLEIDGTFDDGLTVDYELDGFFASAVLRW